MKLKAEIAKNIKGYLNRFTEINDDRKTLLNAVADYIQQGLQKKEAITLVFICTHNSRRSHLAQVWATAVAAYFNLPVSCHSGGMEVTALYKQVVITLETSGFIIHSQNLNAENPIYQIHYSNEKPPLLGFSKTYFELLDKLPFFAAIMTCSDADEACPFIPGAQARFSLPYDDPKIADGTTDETALYAARSTQIAIEMAYLFSQVVNA